MTTTTITVPTDKAESLKLIAAATPETLRILAEKCKGKNEKQFLDLEKKLKSYQLFI